MNKDASIQGIFGGRGSGKSTRLKELIEERGINRLIALDPTGEYAADKSFRSFKSIRGLLMYLRDNWQNNFRAALVIQRGQNAEEVLDRLSDILFSLQRPYKNGKDKRQITLAVDELALCYPEKTLSKDQQNFKELINLGRHYGVNIIGASQRIAEVKKTFVGNCAEHYFFRMGAAVDYTSAGQLIGRENVAELKKLDTHEYLHFSAGKVTKGKNQCNWKRRK